MCNNHRAVQEHCSIHRWYARERHSIATDKACPVHRLKIPGWMSSLPSWSCWKNISGAEVAVSLRLDKNILTRMAQATERAA